MSGINQNFSALGKVRRPMLGTFSAHAPNFISNHNVYLHIALKPNPTKALFYSESSDAVWAIKAAIDDWDAIIEGAGHPTEGFDRTFTLYPLAGWMLMNIGTPDEGYLPMAIDWVGDLASVNHLTSAGDGACVEGIYNTATQQFISTQV